MEENNQCCNCPYKSQTYTDKINEIRDYIYKELERLGLPKVMTPKKYEYYMAIRRILQLSYNLQDYKHKDVVKELIHRGYSVDHIKVSIGTIIHAIIINRSVMNEEI